MPHAPSMSGAELRLRAGRAPKDPFQRVLGGDFDDWWARKRRFYAAFLSRPTVDLDDPTALTRDEHAALSARIDAANMALYRVRGNTRAGAAGVVALGRQFGLVRAERSLRGGGAVSEIAVSIDAGKRRYIPYSERALRWHTDGCYNPGARAVHAFILHCVAQAPRGGGNRLLDHEMLYGLLREDDTVDAAALFGEAAFTIPANVEDGTVLRPRYTGAVFSVIGGRLHARYSARRHNIEWSRDPALRHALAAVERLLAHSRWVLEARLEPGMGVISRNTLHDRGAFDDAGAGRRRLLRARYHDPLNDRRLTATREALVETPRGA